MKFHPFVAAAMLLASGSALAYAPAYYDMDKTEAPAVAGKGAELGGFKYQNDAPKAKDAAFAIEEPKVVPAVAMSWDNPEAEVAGNPDLDLAETSIDDSVPVEPVMSDMAHTQTAMGAPRDQTAVASVTPRPASQNYPACQPGPGDDNCIQLYEPGVQTALASWTAPTGGVAESGEAMAATATTESLNAESLALASAQVDAIRSDGTALASAEVDQPAVGGPYEPVVDDLAMNGDFDVNEDLGETEDRAEI